MSVPGGGGGWGPPQGQPQWSPAPMPGPGGGGPGGAGPSGGGPAGAPSEAKGTWIGVILSVLFLLGSFFACAVTGVVAANESERVAMEVSYVTVPTILAGLLPWIVALLLRKKGTGVAVGAPIGCGCLTWVVSLISVVVFFQVVWPSL